MGIFATWDNIFNSDPLLRLPGTNWFFTSVEPYTETIPTVTCDVDPAEFVIIGRYIDNKRIFAITYSDADNMIYFYRLNKNKWKEIGRNKMKLSNVYQIYFEEFNAEPGLEIVAATARNMNFNSWMKLFSYSAATDSVTKAGYFCTDYEVDLENRTVRENYEGSNHMEPHKTLYKWIDNMLVPVKSVKLALPENARRLQYFESKGRALKLIFDEPWDEDNDKHQMYWNDFFELDNVIGYTEFEAYWERFRAGILNRDTYKLANLIADSVKGDCIWNILLGDEEETRQNSIYNGIPRKTVIENIDSIFTPGFRNLLQKYNINSDLYSDMGESGKNYKCLQKSGKTTYYIETVMDQKFDGDNVAACHLGYYEEDADVAGSLVIRLWFRKTNRGIELFYVNCLG